MATADTVPVTVASREAWFRDFDPERRPLWVLVATDQIVGWLSVRSFYGRPAYHATAEVGVYIAPPARRAGHARTLLVHAIENAPALGIRTLLGFIFWHNTPSVALFERSGFTLWGRLPDVAELDGVRRDLVILGKQLG